MSKSENTQELYVTADTVDEAAQFVVDQLKAMTVQRKARGFTVPELLNEDILLLDGKWTRGFNFRAEFLPAVA